MNSQLNFKMTQLDKAKKQAYTKAARKQINLISNAGADPTWDLFTHTFGFFQMKERYKFTQEDIDLYKQVWEKEVRKLYKKIEDAGLNKEMYFKNQLMLHLARSGEY